MSHDIDEIRRIADMLTDDPYVFNEWDPHAGKPKDEDFKLQHQNLDKHGKLIPPKRKSVIGNLPSPLVGQGKESPPIFGKSPGGKTPGAGPRESVDRVIQAIADSCGELYSGL